MSDSSKPLPVDPGLALWNQRHNVKDALPRLEAFLKALLDCSHMVMQPEDYATIFATVLEYKPDLVIEVGRNFGNTTCILTEAVQSLPGTTVLSICLTNHWESTTLPAIKSLTSADWLRRLDARVMNVMDLDIAEVLKGKRRVFFLLDAHGWDVAEYMLSAVMPELVRRDHMLFIHDVIFPRHFADVYEKYFPDSPSRPSDGMEGYGRRGIWRGEETPDQLVFLNGLAGSYPEFVAFVDFVNRNKLELHAVETSVRREIEDQADRRREMLGLLGDAMYAPSSGFAWFSLRAVDDPSALKFPVINAKARASVVEELREDLSRNLIAGKPSPVTVSRIIAKAMLGRYTTQTR